MRQATIGREGDTIDRIRMVAQGIKQRAAGHMPQLDGAIPRARSKQGAIGRKGHAIDPTFVPFERLPECATCHSPQPHGIVIGA
jgi:hypothetical protein